jgi:predicted dehydrogenase
MMGARHLRGYAELEDVLPGSLRLCAVCDLQVEAAERVAEEAERRLGYRPDVYRTVEEALEGHPEIEAADVVVGNRAHDSVVIPLLEADLDILVEKPLAVTVARGRRMVEVARRRNRILAVAENNRRDPMNRLMRHILQSGLIGRPNFVLQTSIGTGRRIIASPWRHAMSNGGLALDVGIHQAYILEMLLGPIQTVYAVSQQVWPKRQWRRPDGTVEEIPVESDDLFAATLTFENGVQGVWVMYFGSAGIGQWGRIIFGDQGTLEGPSDRSGRPVKVQRGGETLTGDSLLDAIPDFRLNEIEARLFGGERLASYSFESVETDRKLIAAELADFIAAVRERRKPEVPGELGLRAVAIIRSVLESAATGRPIDVENMLSR